MITRTLLMAPAWAVLVVAGVCIAQPSGFPTTARSVPLPATPRPWGPEQATGAPDTPTPGDHQTAWASLTEDDQDEWLELDYAQPITPALIRIYETFNPGAVSAISLAGPDGKLVEVWSGQDPTWPGAAGAISEFPVKVNFPTQRVRIEIASSQIPGWNEIDAVGLVDADGKVQWAKSARASSTYADQVQQANTVRRLEMVPGHPRGAAVAPANATKAPANAVTVSYVKDAPQAPDDYRSLGGSGHAVAFERPANAKDLIAVQIYASRYGMPQAPAEDFHVYLLNEKREVIGDFPFAYSHIARGGALRWYTLDIKPAGVPERFYVALSFNPHQTKGIYLGMDKSVAESHSLTGLPDKGFQPVPDKYDWMIRVCFAPDSGGIGPAK